MDEVTPWIKDYFLNLATTYGSDFETVPPAEKVRRCQLKKVLTSEPGDYFWVVFSDKEHEIQGRIPKEVVEQCIKDARRGTGFTRHRGSLIEIRYFTPLFIRIQDGPSHSAPRKVLALDVRKAKLRGAAGEPTWGSPQSLESVEGLKEWVHELRKPDGNRDLLKIRKQQQQEAEAAKQLTESPQPPPDLGPRLQLIRHAPVAAQQKAAPATPSPPVVERLPMQRYCRKWKKAVPGLNEFSRLLQIPENVQSEILEKQKSKEGKANSRSSVRGALEIGSSPARLSSVPRATTPEEWPTSPSVLRRLYNDRETEMSSDVYSSRLSSPVDGYHDTELGEIELQPELETVPETPQIPPDSQTQHLSPPPPAQPPRPQSPLPPSSNPQAQHHPTSPSSIHTSVQAVSGSQLPENPPTWDRSDDVPSNGPTFVLPWTQRDDPLAAVPKSTPGSHPSPEKSVTKPPNPVKEPTQPGVSKPQEKEPMVKETPRDLAETVLEAIERAFGQESQEEVAPLARDPSTVLLAPKLTVAQLPPPKPRSKPPSRAIQKSLPRPSPSDRLTESEHLESPVHQALQALNRKVPAPKIGPTREPVRGRNENGVVTMVLVPASDDTKLSSSSKQNSSSQPVQSSRSVPSSLPVPPSARLPPSQSGPPYEPQIRHPASQSDSSIAQEGDSLVVQVGETVADIKSTQNRPGNTQSSLEYASTQEEDKVEIAVDLEPQGLMDKPTEGEVVKEKATDEPLESSLPQITVICEAESPQNAAEEVDELESDSEAGDLSLVLKRKPKPSNSPIKATKHLQSSEATKPDSPSKPRKPASRSDSVVEKVQLRPSSKFPPTPFVLIERKHTPVAERTTPAQKRRLTSPTSPSEEGFPAPQPLKRRKINGYRPPVPTTPPQIPRASPLHEGDDVGNRMTRETVRVLKENQAAQKPVVSSEKGKGRAEGIKGLENVSTSTVAVRESETVRAQAKRKAPDTGSKRKPSDAFSAQDDSRDVKRPKVAKEPEPRKPGKQLSFVDPDELKRPFRSKPQIRKTPYHQETTVPAITGAVEPDNGGQTSKYFDPRLCRKPEYPRTITTPEAEQLHKTIRSDGVAHENGRDSGDTRPRIDARKSSESDPDHKLPGKGRKTSCVPDDDESPGRSAPASRVQQQKPAKEAERDLVTTQPQYRLARKLGSFAPDLNPPPLPGLAGGRLMNKRLREILIRTGKVRTREAKATEPNHACR